MSQRLKGGRSSTKRGRAGRGGEGEGERERELASERASEREKQGGREGERERGRERERERGIERRYRPDIKELSATHDGLPTHSCVCSANHFEYLKRRTCICAMVR